MQYTESSTISNNHTGGKCVTCRGLHILASDKDNSINHSCVSPRMGCYNNEEDEEDDTLIKNILKVKILSS